MNQRIVLPAIVIGGVAAVALTFVRGLLPEAGTGVRFAIDAAFLIGAVLVYGLLMREAAAAAGAADASREQAARGRGRGRENRQGTDRGRGRGADGRGGSGGGRDAGSRSERPRREREKDRPRARDTQPAAPTGPREEGQVKWFSGAKGYGFVIRPNGDEIFVHHRALRDKSRREIPDGQPVSYVVVDRDKGPQADDVEVLGTQQTENAA
jgi:cold shock CspA family protein